MASKKTRSLYFIDRAAAIIKPKQPYVDWANQLPDATFETSQEKLREDCHVVLIDEYDSHEQALKIIEDIWEDIFDHCLGAWCTKSAWWPKKRTFKMFKEWFDLEFHETIIDPYDDEIEKELF